MQAVIYSRGHGAKVSRARLRKLVTGIIEAAGLERQAVHVTLVNDNEMQALNLETFGKDKPTNVISFPLGGVPGEEVSLLGDVVVSVDTARREAEHGGLSLETRVAQLIIHGFVHLLGYEHVDVPPAEARRMRREEQRIFKEVEELVPGIVADEEAS